jgi:hypothetical protein
MYFINGVNRGKNGVSATLKIGTVAAGDTPAVVNKGDEYNAVLDITLPKGEKGDIGATGPKGDTGSAATVKIGKVTKGADASVTNSGTDGAAVLDFVIPTVGEKGEKGDTGTQGPAGPVGPEGPKGDAGPAATVKVGTVTTGSTPSVKNSGTDSAAVLDFVLPADGGSGSSTAISYRDMTIYDATLDTTKKIIADGETMYCTWEDNCLNVHHPSIKTTSLVIIGSAHTTSAADASKLAAGALWTPIIDTDGIAVFHVGGDTSCVGTYCNIAVTIINGAKIDTKNKGVNSYGYSIFAGSSSGGSSSGSSTVATVVKDLTIYDTSTSTQTKQSLENGTMTGCEWVDKSLRIYYPVIKPTSIVVIEPCATTYQTNAGKLAAGMLVCDSMAAGEASFSVKGSGDCIGTYCDIRVTIVNGVSTNNTIYSDFTGMGYARFSGGSSAGAKGDKGDKGDTGATGATGPAGKSATQTTATVTLAAASWSSAAQTVSNAAIKADSMVYLTLPATSTADNYDAVAGAKIICTAQTAGSVTLKALGTVPTKDVSINLVIQGVE